MKDEKIIFTKKFRIQTTASQKDLRWAFLWLVAGSGPLLTPLLTSGSEASMPLGAVGWMPQEAVNMLLASGGEKQDSKPC